MSKPFDFHSYEFPREALRIGNCDYGSQISLFSTPIFQYRLKDISICQEVSNLVKSNISNFEEKWINYQKGSSKYIHNTLTSDDDLHLDPKFNSLLNAINPIIKITIDTLNLSTNGFDILSMWSNINGRGGYLATHSHPNSFLSGVLYLQTPGSNKGKIFFENPVEGRTNWQFDPHDFKTSMFQYRSWEFEPRVGTLLMFPSWIRHGTYQGDWEDDEYRMSLSFNIMPKFKCTTNTMKYNLQG
jgi:uncharacterized protein (TIGR02466 family)